jgi:peptidoglycan/xylan/chitin deacetylase (PgdA/CDA1 family)
VQGLGRIALVVLLTLATGGARARAEASPPQPATPLHLRATTLRQDGSALVWSLAASRAWTPASLAADGRSLCLRLRYRTPGVQVRDVCVERTEGTVRLVYARVLRSGGHGPLHPLSARVRRPDGRSLVARFDPAKLAIPYARLRWRTLSSTDGCLIAQDVTCFEALPSRGALLELSAPPPVGCTPAGPAYVTNGSRRRHVVALTFDDGPSAYTSAVLDVLARERVHATFFLIGQQVAGGAALVRRELAEGHMLGAHAWNHPDLAHDPALARRQIRMTTDAIQRASGFRPCLFRAPFGDVSSGLIALARALGFTTIQWDVDPQDWSLPGSGAIVARVVGGVRNGSIILLHDGGGPRSQTLAALPRIIHALKARNYGFVTVDRLTGARLRYG